MAGILVTGASTGIGEACALHLDQLGHRVFAGVRKDADAERLAQQASSRLEPVFLDVTDAAQIDAVAKHLDESLGTEGLAGVVNNAGVARGGPLEFLPVDEWRDQFEVNVFGQIAVARATIPLLRRGRGRIVFIGSIAGRASSPMMGPYAASKHAIEAIGEALREELRPWGIAVAVVEPGAIKTAIWDKGRETAARLEEELGAEAHRLYGDQIDAVRAMIEKQDRAGIPPRKVAEAVAHALFNARPRYRYLVGTDALVGGTLERLLPDRAFAFVARKLA